MNPRSFCSTIMLVVAIFACTSQAQQNTAQDLFDLLEAKKIEVVPQGQNIQSVRVGIRRLVNTPLNVRIPVGAYFVANNSDSQNMVTRQAATIALTTKDWFYMEVSAACANRPRDIPDGEDRFSVQRSPHQQELARLMVTLQKARVSYPVEQAAIWIVTDDADFDDMGVLVNASTETRVIDHEDAVHAMKLVREAGIEVKEKSIWQDRDILIPEISDPVLKSWIQKTR